MKHEVCFKTQTHVQPLISRQAPTLHEQQQSHQHRQRATDFRKGEEAMHVRLTVRRINVHAMRFTYYTRETFLCISFMISMRKV